MMTVIKWFLVGLVTALLYKLIIQIFYERE